MVIKDIISIFEKVQASSSSHQKNVIVLMDLYKKMPREGFLRVFLTCLQEIVRQSIDNSLYTKRVLTFASQFCSEVTKKEEKESESHEFLTAVIEKVLMWSVLDMYEIRYNCCCFLSMVLQDIGEEIQLEINLIDEIQEVLLERMLETKVPIRLVAMSAMVRLQEPLNPECPVVDAYRQALSSASAIIRRDALQKIAPNAGNLPAIISRIRDCDPSVRSMAFQKCADIGPWNFKIIDKHMILFCGFQETDNKVKNKFYDCLLPKWLTAYEGDYLKFIKALKLIADEEDINKMTYLTKELIKEFYSKHPIEDLISVLPINEDKLVNVENLTTDVTLVWNILTSLLRDSDATDEYVNRILPELTPFTHYIDKVIRSKSKERMDEWQHFEYQFDLLNLFEIAENYDFSDEVGRRTIQAFTVSVLQSHHFTPKLTKKLVSIAQKCSSNIDFFTHDLCQLISNIREPLMEEPLSQDQLREREFKAAELKVRLNILKEHHHEAIVERNYKKAQELDDEQVNCKKQLEMLQNHADVEKVRVTKSDNETLCRCLDILASVLELPAVSKMTPSLITCKDNFLVPLISCHEALEPHWRILRCLGLFSIIDKATAEEYAKVISIPIATYRTVPINNVSALIQSISGVTDLISLYGVKIVGSEEGEDATINETNQTQNTTQNNTKRKLYSVDVEEDMLSGRIDNINNMTLAQIFEIFLDMLDDERDEIRHQTVLAITALVKSSFPVTPTVLSRILLKWYNPLTEKQDTNLQIHLGLLIEQFAATKNSIQIMKEAIMPTLSSIARAPRSSPLVDIDIDNVVMFFSANMNIHLQKDDIRILALDICMKICENSNARVVPYLTKLLSNLDIEQTTPEALDELIERTNQTLEVLKDKASKKYVEKFASKLKMNQANALKQQQTDEVEVEANKENSSLQEETDNDRNIMKEPQQVKRRKNRANKECVVVLEKMNLFSVNNNVTPLDTITETSVEMEIDEDLTTDEQTSDSSKSSKTFSTRTNSVVISETSDSDFSNDSEVTRRRSNRCRKKRIL